MYRAKDSYLLQLVHIYNLIVRGLVVCIVDHSARTRKSKN